MVRVLSTWSKMNLGNSTKKLRNTISHCIITSKQCRRHFSIMRRVIDVGMSGLLMIGVARMFIVSRGRDNDGANGVTAAVVLRSIASVAA